MKKLYLKSVSCLKNIVRGLENVSLAQLKDFKRKNLRSAIKRLIKENTNKMTNDYEEKIELLELDGVAGRYLADQVLDSNEQETLLNLENHRSRLSAEMWSSRFVETRKVENSKFPIGSRIKIIKRFVDFKFFRLGETGTVIKNSGEYLGIIVLLDCPHFLKEVTTSLFIGDLVMMT